MAASLFLSRLLAPGRGSLKVVLDCIHLHFSHISLFRLESRSGGPFSFFLALAEIKRSSNDIACTAFDSFSASRMEADSFGTGRTWDFHAAFVALSSLEEPHLLPAVPGRAAGADARP